MQTAFSWHIKKRVPTSETVKSQNGKNETFDTCPWREYVTKRRFPDKVTKKTKKSVLFSSVPDSHQFYSALSENYLLKYCLELRWVTKCCKYLCKFASLQNLFHVWKKMSDLACIKQTLQLENLIKQCLYMRQSSEMLIHQYYHNSNLPVPVTTELKYFRFW